MVEIPTAGAGRPAFRDVGWNIRLGLLAALFSTSAVIAAGVAGYGALTGEDEVVLPWFVAIVGTGMAVGVWVVLRYRRCAVYRHKTSCVVVGPFRTSRIDLSSIVRVTAGRAYVGRHCAVIVSNDEGREKKVRAVALPIEKHHVLFTTPREREDNRS